MNKLGKWLAAAIVFAFRLLSWVSLACVILFPAYKRVWLGFVPVLLAFSVCLCWRLSPQARAGVVRISSRLAGLSGRSFIAWALLAVLIVQVFLVLGLRPVPIQDARHVLSEAMRLAETGTMSLTTYYAPLQTWWYAAFFKVFGSNALVAQLSNVPIVLLIVLITYLLAKLVLPRDRARAAVLIAAFYPAFVCFVLTTPYYYYL
ncbi:MAG: hypothetical protein JXQ75_01190, partial [Phycisphaerae bacterium]|nr:hypothetical protein [Phycisphaerae bacterium]